MSTAEADAIARLRTCDFRGAAKRLDDIDLPRLGHLIGVGEDEVHAFLDVETSGGGFYKSGPSAGRPKALYEPHRAYALSSGATRAALVAADLAYPKWGQKPYPKDSYARILAAMKIDPRVALEATSWGLGQVLGSNHVAAGYGSAAEMVAACLDDEEAHLAQAVAFIKANHLDDELRAHNWAAFARGYNGPQYAKNGYDRKLAAAYAKWSGIADTPWAPRPATPTSAKPAPKPTAPKAAADRWAEAGLARYEVEAVQKRLRDLGFFMVGKVDGQWGPATAAAITALQAQAGIAVDGHWGPQTKAALDDDANRRRISAARASTTAADLRAQGSATVIQGDRITWTSAAGLLVALGGAAYSAWQAPAELPPGSSILLAFMPPAAAAIVSAVGPFLLAFVPLAYSILAARGIISARVEAERTGLHNGEPDPAPSPPVTYPADGPRLAWPFSMLAPARLAS